MDIEDKFAIIAGGASGIGQATALALAQLGAQVAILDLNEALAKETAKACQGKYFVCDITSDVSLQSAIQNALSYFKSPVKIAINCAGIAPAKRLVGKTGPCPLDFFQSVINVNLVGTYNVMRLVAESMCQSEPDSSGERGVIINTASIAAYDGQIGQTAYAASKGGVVALTLPAARELGPFGVRVMTIAPGLIDTPLLQALPAEVKSTLKETIPYPKRFGKPKEYASLAIEIIKNPLLNGEVIRLDGALRMT